jgi:hypothetical protein
MPSEAGERKGGMFDVLKAPPNTVRQLMLPPKSLSWEKFAREVLPEATALEVHAPRVGSYYGLVTAADPEAKPILQWDGLVGQLRNPVNWYFYHGGSPAETWRLTAGWQSVSAVFLAPHQWQEPDRFTHQGENVFFAIEGAQDTREGGLALFPETLRQELREIRSVVEAYSRTLQLEGRTEGNANGIAFGRERGNLRVRVTARGSITEYTLDRWD